MMETEKAQPGGEEPEDTMDKGKGRSKTLLTLGDFGLSDEAISASSWNSAVMVLF